MSVISATSAAITDPKARAAYMAIAHTFDRQGYYAHQVEEILGVFALALAAMIHDQANRDQLMADLTISVNTVIDTLTKSTH